jgi:methyladenine glycosylase
LSAQQSNCEELSRAIRAIDEMTKLVDCFKNAQFTQEAEKRSSLTPDFNWKDEHILCRLIALIAYSNNAKAAGVTRILESGVFNQVFQNYSVEKVAELSAENIIRTFWQEIKVIRFKRKVDAMIRCANCVLSIRKRHGSFMGYLSGVRLPSAVRSEFDMRAFWEGFSRIQADFRELEFPYFQNFTSLCHLLMDRGFDCAKPDSAVMKAAVDLEIVPPPPNEKSRAHPEESLQKTVETIQAYAFHRNTRAPVIDLYFLVQGGQSGVNQLIKHEYYSDPRRPSRKHS